MKARVCRAWTAAAGAGREKGEFCDGLPALSGQQGGQSPGGQAAACLLARSNIHLRAGRRSRQDSTTSALLVGFGFVAFDLACSLTERH